MPQDIFTEYDTCSECQSLELKTANLANITQHLISAHGHSDVSLYSLSRNPKYRAVFTELYTLTKPYHEPNFDRDLKLAFHDKAWEMITCRSLINSSHTVSQSTAQAGPDFITDKAFVECINAAPAADYTPTPTATTPEEMVFEEVPETNIQLRITNAFVSKSRIIKKYIDRGIIDESKPVIIALNYARVHKFSWADSEELSDNLLLRSLFGMGPLSMTIDSENPEPSEFTVSFQPQITKGNYAEVPADYFLTDTHKHISGVVYSNHQIESSESNEVSIVNNPFATVKLELSDYSDLHRVLADLGTSTLHKTPRCEEINTN